MKCDRCGKGVLVGMNVSHSHIRTKKRSYPNLHAFKMKVKGVTRRLRLCTKCLRIVKKEAAVAVRTSKTVTPATLPRRQAGTEDTDKKTEGTERTATTENTEKKTEDSEEKAATTKDTEETEVAEGPNKTKHTKTTKRQKKAA